MNRTGVKTAVTLAAWACIVTIVVLSLAPADEMVRTGADGHLEHTAAYAGTGFFVGIAYRVEERWAVLGGLMSALAGTMEILQHFSPGRHPGFSDFGASSIGAVIGLAVAGLAVRNMLLARRSVR
ncbi:VanZ family protein [Azospirillum rugosum]|uniref:VanZ family protein n=1 Tax=Azospirillum rugosum TaxID=416170 RepID=A0ABS4SJX1_9PROT|nr:VanZ family protein [Azospirillum rugosum]MBP2292797.1 VanZ family protein [Azospirillum rugosum]MDQ0527056.1 VanZ family protein [Azospirillum rugosum]